MVLKRLQAILEKLDILFVRGLVLLPIGMIHGGDLPGRWITINALAGLREGQALHASFNLRGHRGLQGKQDYGAVQNRIQHNLTVVVRRWSDCERLGLPRSLGKREQTRCRKGCKGSRIAENGTPK